MRFVSGRRGKAAAATESQPPPQEETPPSTSEIQTTSTPTPRERPQPAPQELEETTWGRGRPSQPPTQKAARPPQETPNVLGRGRGRGGYQQIQEKPPQGRGKGRGVVPHKPGYTRAQTCVEASSKQSQGGARHEAAKVQLKETTECELPSQSLSLSEIADLVPFKPGVSGRKIRIETNHFRLNLGTLTTAYRYSVDFSPEKSVKRLLKRAVTIFLKNHVPDYEPCYDGQHILYSARKLPLVNDTVSGNVAFQEKDSPYEVKFEITIRLTGTIDLSPLYNLLQKKNIGLGEAFQCVETVFKQAYTNSFLSIGRRFYTPSTGNEYPLGSGAVMYLGGYQAAVSGWIPFLNVDVAHKAFTNSTSIIDLIKEMFSTKYKPVQAQDLQNNGLQKWQIEPLTEYLKGLRVVYQIPNQCGSKKIYKVNGFANIPSQEKFQFEDQVLTVEHYFKRKWHCTLKYPKLPTLWVGNEKKRICVPMEYCHLKDGQPLAGSRLLKNQTAIMTNSSATSTSERKKKIQDVMQKANHNDNPCIREFGFSISETFECVDARVLDPPRLEYCDGKVDPKNGTWWAKKFKVGAEIRQWTIIGFGVQHDRIGTKVNELARQVQL
mgnify:CR=1 FL=1